MPISLSKAKLAEVIGGRALEPSSRDEKIVFRGIEFDSRNIRGGELFIALPGANAHGHDHVPQALSRGAALVLVERADLFEKLAERELVLVVPDSLKAFSRLATWWRKELNLPTAAITGSVGKTTVKEIAAHILMSRGAGTYSQKSFNNHVGVPYTICQMHPDHRWAVLEMGMNHAGEISELTRLAAPDHVAITSLAPAHIEGLGSMEAIAKAKFEIVEGLRAGGNLIFPDGEPLLEAERTCRDPQGKIPVQRFGRRTGLGASIANLKSLGLEGISFSLSLGGSESAEVKMQVIGTQNAMNAAAAALVAKCLAPELSLREISDRLSTFVSPLMRMNLKTYSENCRLIDDTYNANPASMGAFLDLAADMQQAGYAVLLLVGDMLELGSFSESYHRQIGARISKVKPSALVVVGDHAKWYLEEFNSSGFPAPYHHAKSPEAAASWMLDCLKGGALPSAPEGLLFMAKASRGVGLDRAIKVIDRTFSGEAPGNVSSRGHS